MAKRFTRDVGEEIRDAVSSGRLETLDDFKTRIGYQGCLNCEHQIEPLRMCVWAETKVKRNDN